MSISLLLEKYDVSTDEGLQKALAEIEKEESEVDEALTSALGRACTIEGRLRSASQGYNKLTEVKADAQTAADMVEKTAALARDVSAKVRQLDLARSRVAECQRRVHDLIDLQLCSAGVEAAIKAHDYETGAAHVSRFLSMDPGSVAAAKARGAADPREPMTKAANTLREHIVRKFEEAARKEDEANIERLFKLFPMIGRAEEGVNLLSKYLAGQLEVKLRKASAITGSEGSEAVFADAVTRVVETAGGAVRRAAALAAPAPCADRAHAHVPVVPLALHVLQPQVCSAIRRIYLGLVTSRRLDADGRGVTGVTGATGATPAPLQLEPTLGELALILSRIRLYCDFLYKRTEADVANLEESKRQMYIEKVEKMIASSDMTRTAQDLLSHYLTLERYFLEESVNKALKMSTPQPGDSTTSLVDDVFFIARKVIRRAVSTGSVGGVCAALNEVCGALERCAGAGADGARGRLRVAPHDVLPLPAPPPAPHDRQHAPDAPQALHDRLNREVSCARSLFLSQLSEAECGAEWAARLAEEALAAAAPLCRRGAERDQLAECAAGLATAHTAFTQAAEAGRAAILSSLQPRVLAWAERLGQSPPPPGALPAALDALGEAARAHLSPATAEWLLVAVVGEVATHAERCMLRGVYDAESGMEVEACARRLAAWAGGAAPGARERAARLAQGAALLALESPALAPDALRPAPRLPLATARDLLARRTDFKIEEIKRLKL